MCLATMLRLLLLIKASRLFFYSFDAPGLRVRRYSPLPFSQNHHSRLYEKHHDVIFSTVFRLAINNRKGNVQGVQPPVGFLRLGARHSQDVLENTVTRPWGDGEGSGSRKRGGRACEGIYLPPGPVYLKRVANIANLEKPKRDTSASSSHHYRMHRLSFRPYLQRSTRFPNEHFVSVTSPTAPPSPNKKVWSAFKRPSHQDWSDHHGSSSLVDGLRHPTAARYLQAYQAQR
ncbi:hypothetical protein IW261DRAFT_1422422 [Armillaria novae-zelandiae]|uniref:Secreted protein n=1 Tax=Armillaria novae-zelandiae TaxID=153914 RepID=A0AA39P046_9AGAR|nr:hypothetical protein IW261DRAFT_1422422 [Armillaria novae-zelandiae]